MSGYVETAFSSIGNHSALFPFQGSLEELYKLINTSLNLSSQAPANQGTSSFYFVATSDTLQQQHNTTVSYTQVQTQPAEMIFIE